VGDLTCFSSFRFLAPPPRPLPSLSLPSAGEGGLLVGADLKGKKVLVVDDVISAGTERAKGRVPPFVLSISCWADVFRIFLCSSFLCVSQPADTNYQFMCTTMSLLPTRAHHFPRLPDVFNLVATTVKPRLHSRTLTTHPLPLLHRRNGHPRSHWPHQRWGGNYHWCCCCTRPPREGAISHVLLCGLEDTSYIKGCSWGTRSLGSVLVSMVLTCTCVVNLLSSHAATGENDGTYFCHSRCYDGRDAIMGAGESQICVYTHTHIYAYI
jgi:hypothetical protein